jgi:hypothetical protein
MAHLTRSGDSVRINAAPVPPVPLFTALSPGLQLSADGYARHTSLRLLSLCCVVHL